MASSKSKNYFILLLALTTIAGGVLAWNQYLELVKLRGGNLDDPARTDLQKRLWDLEKRNHELQAENANLRARETTVAEDEANPDPAAAPDGARPGAGRFNRRDGFGNLSVLLDNPEFNKLWTQQQRDRMKLAYADLFKRLSLTPDRADKLNSLLVERQMSVMDVLSAARAQGITGRDQIASLLQQANSQIDSQIQSLLGPDGYAQYTNYVQTQPQRAQVSELQTRLAAAGAQPLQDYQSQQLAQILAQNTQADGRGPRGGAVAGMMGGLFGATVTGPTITPNAVTQAATVLTPDQWQALQQMKQEQTAQQQLMNLLRRSFNGSATRGAGATPSGQSGTAPAPSPAPSGG